MYHTSNITLVSAKVVGKSGTEGQKLTNAPSFVVVFEVAQEGIAASVQYAPDSPGLVVVVKHGVLPLLVQVNGELADCAAPLLLSEESYPFDLNLRFR
jgi:hypothetical protein